jgi:class 3 adenylate cyclase
MTYRPHSLRCLRARSLLRPLHQRGEVPLAREQRKLATVLAADVVGYSRLMGRDESGTLARAGRHLIQDRSSLILRSGGGYITQFSRCP